MIQVAVVALFALTSTPHDAPVATNLLTPTTAADWEVADAPAAEASELHLDGAWGTTTVGASLGSMVGIAAVAGGALAFGGGGLLVLLVLPGAGAAVGAALAYGRLDGGALLEAFTAAIGASGGFLTGVVAGVGVSRLAGHDVLSTDSFAFALGGAAIGTVVGSGLGGLAGAVRFGAVSAAE